MLQFQDETALIKWVLNQALPGWQSKLFKRYSDAIKVHSQGLLFYKIDQLFPNEHPHSKAHRILAFESITEASFGRAANNINRIFKNSSYTVEASEKTLQYLAEDNFEGETFFTWFLDQWTEFALNEDPNTRFVVYPPEYVQKYGRPPVCFVPSSFIKHFSDDALVFISEEESVVEYAIEETRTWEGAYYDQSIERINFKEVQEKTFSPQVVAKVKRPVYHVFLNGIGFYRIEESAEDSKKYEYELFPIKVDFIPGMDVGGRKKAKLDVNKSFLQPFVSFGNLALLQHSQHTAVNFTFSFPRMSEIETPCEAEGCSKGRIQCDESPEFPEGWKPCKACNGSGYKAAQSPYKIYKKRFDPLGMEGDNDHLKVPDVQYYTPDTSILDYSKKEWKDYLEQAETAVYVQQRIKTGNVEAAKSKEIDREDLYTFLSKVGQVYFSRLRFAIQCFENYLIANPTQVSVANPYSYAILTEGEAFDSLQTMLNSNVPIMLKANSVENFINKFVSMSSPIKKFLEVLKNVDPLLYYSDAQLTQYKIGGVISADQLAVHVFAYPALQQLYNEDKTLFLQDAKVIEGKLVEALKQYKPAPPPPPLKTQLLTGA